MKKVFVLFFALLVVVGCGGVAIYDEGTFTFEYPSSWQIVSSVGGVVVKDSDGTPSINLTTITSDFGMEGYEKEKEESYTNSNDVSFKLIYNKIDIDSANLLEWEEGKTMYENDTTSVLISTSLYESPIFFVFDKNDSNGEEIMKAILNSFRKK